MLILYKTEFSFSCICVEKVKFVKFIDTECDNISQITLFEQMFVTAGKNDIL